MRNVTIAKLSPAFLTAAVVALAVLGRAPLDTSDPASNGPRRDSAGTASLVTPHHAP